VGRGLACSRISTATDNTSGHAGWTTTGTGMGLSQSDGAAAWSRPRRHHMRKLSVPRGDNAGPVVFQVSVSAEGRENNSAQACLAGL
jgi:hypothetical protein